MRLSRVESGKNPARMPDFRLGSIIEKQRYQFTRGMLPRAGRRHHDPLCLLVPPSPPGASSPGVVGLEFWRLKAVAFPTIYPTGCGASPPHSFGWVLISRPTRPTGSTQPFSAELSISLSGKFRIAVETCRNGHGILRNRRVLVCGYRAGYFGLGLPPGLGPNLVRNRRFPAGSLKCSGPF